MPSRTQTVFACLGVAAATLLVATLLRPVPQPRLVNAEGRIIENVALTRTLDHFDTQGLSFREALQKLADSAGVGLVIHQHELEAAGIDVDDKTDPTRATNVRLRKVRIATAIDAVLADRGRSATIRLASWPAGDQLHVSTVEDADVQTRTTRVYDVGALLAGMLRTDRSFWAVGATAFDDPATRPATAGTFVNCFPAPTPPTNTDEAGDTLRQIIQDSVGVGSWREDGGTVGSMRFFGNAMIVTQSAANHDGVVALLQVLDAAVAIGQKPAWNSIPLVWH